MYERGISISGLLRRILIRWKVILLIAVICALIGCAMKVVDVRGENINAETGTPENAATAEIEQDPLAEDERYDALLESISNAIDTKLEYLDNSVLAVLNSSKSYMAKATLFVNDHYVSNGYYDLQTVSSPEELQNALYIAPDVLTAMQSVISYSIDYQPLVDRLGLPDVSYAVELFGTSTSVNTLTITTRYTDPETAQEIMDYILEQLESRCDELKEIFGDFELITVYDGVRPEMRNNSWWNDQAAAINNLLVTRNNLIKNRPALILPEDSGLGEAAGDVAHPSRHVSVKSLIKAAILYGAVGLVAAMVFLAILLLIPGKVLSASDLAENYQLRSLASLPQTSLRGRALKGLSYKIANLGSRTDETLTEKDYFALAASDIGAAAEGAGKIALIGDAPKAHLEGVKDALTEIDAGAREYVALPFALQSAESRKSLTDCDGIVLVGEIEYSRYKNLDRLLQIAADRKKEVLGAIVL